MAFNDFEVAIVRGMLFRGDKQQDIAAYFGVNSARINDVKQGLVRAHIEAATPATLPPPGPYMAGRSALRAKETLIALRELIDEAITDIDKFEQTGGE